MVYTKEICILLLLMDFVDTSVVSGATCTADGDVYIPSGDRERGMLSEGLTFAYAVSEDEACVHEQLRDKLRIYGCLKARSFFNSIVFTHVIGRQIFWLSLRGVALQSTEYIQGPDLQLTILSKAMSYNTNPYIDEKKPEMSLEEKNPKPFLVHDRQASPVSAVDIYLRNGKERLLIVRIQCIADQPRRRLHTHSGIFSSLDLRRHRFGPGILTYDHDLRHRRQDVLSGVDTLEKEVKSVKTSVAFEVKLNFSSNDEISISCDPEGMGILYISNPNPDLFKSLLAFSEFTRRRCNTEFYNDGRFVAIGGCSLNMPVIASFSMNQKHAPVIGGAHKVYNINCSDPKIQRGMIFPTLYDEDSGVTGNHQPVTMMTAAVFMTVVFLNLL